MLCTIRRPRLSEEETERARSVIVEDVAEHLTRDFARPRTLSLAPRFWSERWNRELLAVAIAGNEDRGAALQLLELHSRVELDEEERLGLRRVPIEESTAGSPTNGSTACGRNGGYGASRANSTAPSCERPWAVG